MTNNYELSYEELLELTEEIFPQQRCLDSLLTEVDKCLMDFHLQFPNTGTILDTTTFLWLIGQKLIDRFEIQFHIELIRYKTYCPAKQKIQQTWILLN